MWVPTLLIFSLDCWPVVCLLSEIVVGLIWESLEPIPLNHHTSYMLVYSINWFELNFHFKLCWCLIQYLLLWILSYKPCIYRALQEPNCEKGYILFWNLYQFKIYYILIQKVKDYFTMNLFFKGFWNRRLNPRWQDFSLGSHSNRLYLLSPNN